MNHTENGHQKNQLILLNFQASMKTCATNQIEKGDKRVGSTKNSSQKSYKEKEDAGIIKSKRAQFQLVTYAAYLFSATLVPILNLLILFTQSYNLSWDDNFASISRKNFDFYYIGTSYYLVSTLIFMGLSAITEKKWKKLIKIYILMDSNQITVIAANICYICMHLIYLCRDIAGNNYDIQPIDVILLILFALNNFAYVGHFRVSLTHYKWSKTETLTFKILIFLSSLSYFAYGITIMIGQDNLSNLMNQAKKIVQNFIQSTDFGTLTNQVQSQLLQQMNNLQSNINTIQNLISLFVFTSFANICEVLNRMNDFDQSSKLYPNYEIDDQEMAYQPYIEGFKDQVMGKIMHLDERVKNIDIISSTIRSFMPITNTDIQSNLPTKRHHDPSILEVTEE